MAEKRYDHPFNDGDIVTDIELKEIFIFEDARDGFRAYYAEGKTRLATEEEKQRLIDSKETCIAL